jgi:16S rRNA (guanine527-N7)-methyltransferase
MPTAIDKFEAALRDHADEFNVQLDADTSAGLRRYYEVLMKWNARLHLVAPCSPEEFATRHVLESLLLLSHLKPDAAVVDVGSGGGLPMLPLLIAQRDVNGTLIESSQRKSVFLREALRAVSRDAKVLTERFENIPPPVADYVTCRALERLTQKLPAILTWARPNSTLLLFGGQSLTEGLQKLGPRFERVHIPQSLRRYLLIVQPR